MDARDGRSLGEGRLRLGTASANAPWPGVARERKAGGTRQRATMKTIIEKSTARHWASWAVRIACLTLWAIRAAAAGGNDAAFAPDRILVKPKATTKESVVHSLFAKHGAHQDRILHQLDVRLIRVPRGKMATVLQKLKQDRRIEFAEPDWVLGPDTIPNDPYLGN